MNKRELLRIVPWALTVSLVIAGVSRCTKIPENTLWDITDELQRLLWPGGTLNELIIKDPEKLERRVRRDVDHAIREVTPEYDRIIGRQRPRYSEQPVDSSLCWTEGCKALAPAMRICAPWVDGCDGKEVD